MCVHLFLYFHSSEKRGALLLYDIQLICSIFQSGRRHYSLTLRHSTDRTTKQTLTTVEVDEGWRGRTVLLLRHARVELRVALVAVLTRVAAVQSLVVGVVVEVLLSVPLSRRAAQHRLPAHAVKRLHRLRYVVGTCDGQGRNT